MVFELEDNDSSVVDIYKPIGRYKIEGERAYKVNPDGTITEDSYERVMMLINSYRRDGARHYKHRSHINDKWIYGLLAFAAPFVAVIITIFLYIYWPF